MTRRMIGCVTWALWGVLHVVAGAGPVVPVLRGRPDQVLAMHGTEAANLPPVAAALLANHGFNLIWGGVFALVVAIRLNRHGSPGGYLANLAVISGFDIAFLGFMVLPGHVPPLVGTLGPTLWLIGAVALAPDAARVHTPSASAASTLEPGVH